MQPRDPRAVSSSDVRPIGTPSAAPEASAQISAPSRTASRSRSQAGASHVGFVAAGGASLHDLRPVADTDSTRLLNQVPDDLLVYGDASLLRRVLQNLVANAIKYTPRGEIIIGARDLGGSRGVECRVSDNGAGIPPEQLEHIFDEPPPDPEKDGMGLGLAIVKTFVEAHMGHVTVESQEGVGSTFRFTLPGRAYAILKD